MNKLMSLFDRENQSLDGKSLPKTKEVHFFKHLNKTHRLFWRDGVVYVDGSRMQQYLGRNKLTHTLDKFRKNVKTEDLERDISSCMDNSNELVKPIVLDGNNGCVWIESTIAMMYADFLGHKNKDYTFKFILVQAMLKLSNSYGRAEKVIILTNEIELAKQIKMAIGKQEFEMTVLIGMLDKIIGHE
jgi:hypothetical protein